MDGDRQQYVPFFPRVRIHVHFHLYPLLEKIKLITLIENLFKSSPLKGAVNSHQVIFFLKYWAKLDCLQSFW